MDASADAAAETPLRTGGLPPADVRGLSQAFFRRETVPLGRLSLSTCMDASGHFDRMQLNALTLPDQAFLLILMELSLRGMAGIRISRALFRICGSFTEEDVHAAGASLKSCFDRWSSRRLSGSFPYVYVNSHTVRTFSPDGSEVICVFSAVGVSRETGHRECLGFAFSDGSPLSWQAFFRSLANRGLEPPELIIAPLLPNMTDAANLVFPGVRIQRCQEDLVTFACKTIPVPIRKDVRKRAKHMLAVCRPPQAEAELEALCAWLGLHGGSAASILRYGFADAMTVHQFPRILYPRLSALKPNFRKLDETIRIHEKILPVYPGRDAVSFFFGAVFYEFSQMWFASSNPFIPPEAMRAGKDDFPDSALPSRRSPLSC